VQFEGAHGEQVDGSSAGVVHPEPQTNPLAPLVTVIIPTLDSGNTLDGTLRSVADQTYPRVEVVLVDGGSCDSTMVIGARWGVRVIPGRWGRSSARLEGARLARGEYLLFLDSDQQSDRQLIFECVKICQTEGVAAVVIPERSVGTGIWVKYHSLEKQLVASSPDFEYPRFFEKRAYFVAGGHPNEFENYMEDRSLFLNLRRRGWKSSRSRQFITNELGKFNLLAFGGKNARSAMDARSYYETNEGESPFRLSGARLTNLLFPMKEMRPKPWDVLLFSIYLFVGYTPRFLISITGYMGGQRASPIRESAGR
jgi:glycosyltransferase involved in cell wall biosynthesis